VPEFLPVPFWLECMCENPVEQQVLLRIQYGLNQPHEMHAVRSKVVVDLGAGGPAPGARGQTAGVLPCPPDRERPLNPHNPARQGAAAATTHHSSSRRPTPSLLVRQHHRRPTSRTTTMALSGRTPRRWRGHAYLRLACSLLFALG